MSRLLCSRTLRNGLIAYQRRTLQCRPNYSVVPHIEQTLHNCIVPTRKFTTTQNVDKNENLEGNFFKKALKSLGIGKYKYSKATLKRSGYLLFVCMDDLIDFTKFMKELNLPDTFYSYYLICELHVWMLMCRLTQEGEDGKLIKQALCAALWENIETKSKKLGEAATSSSARKENISAMGFHFNAAMFNYDEGILSDDKVLAGAVWRSMFHMDDVDPEILEKTVAYIRKQMSYLDEQDSRLLVRQGIVDFLAYDSDKPDAVKLNETIGRLYQ